MKNSYGIDKETFGNILKVFNMIEQIDNVILFGSRARGDYSNTSDIDIAVKFIEEDKKLLLIRMLEELRCILKFDVLNIDKISNQELLKNIQRDGIQIYKKGE